MRFFGMELWTILDGSLVALGIVSTIYGMKRYLITTKYERRLERRLDHLLILEMKSATTEDSFRK
jgi:hypothetical protein